MIRATDEDRVREDDVCQRLEQAWRCVITRTGYLDAFDFFGQRDGRTVCIGEIKNRNVTVDTYPTLYLSAHKWLMLVTAAAGMNVKAMFVASFQDELRYVDLGQVDARNHTVAGRFDRPDAPNDKELMILVPIEQMRAI